MRCCYPARAVVLSVPFISFALVNDRNWQGRAISITRLSASRPFSEAGSIAKCESPTFAGVCPSETPLARTYRHLDLDERRTLFRLMEARTPVGEIARRLGRHPSTVYRELGRNRFRDGDRGF